MYGGREIHATDAEGPFTFDRQALHAAEITFVHPVMLQTMTLKAPLPPDIVRLMKLVRGGAAQGSTSDSGTVK
jgi:23S rRNA pseudouridine1911/1915/1917 synthase